jgi:hypothetical protein
MRKNPARSARALEAFVVDEAINSFEDRPQPLRELEIEIKLLLFGMNFEDH